MEFELVVEVGVEENVEVDVAWRRPEKSKRFRVLFLLGFFLSLSIWGGEGFRKEFCSSCFDLDLVGEADLEEGAEEGWYLYSDLSGEEGLKEGKNPTGEGDLD